MTRIQLLDSDEYWTQRKDTDSPLNECQVTSAANWITALGITVDVPKLADDSFQRLPDYIDDLTKLPTPKKIAEDEHWTGPPRELHAVLEWAINEAVDKQVDKFSTAVMFETIVFDLFRGRPVIVAGDFTPEGHVVCLTGIETNQNPHTIRTVSNVDLDSVSALLVADPYGDYHTGYKDANGAECRFTVDELIRLLTPAHEGAKWAHRYVG